MGKRFEINITKTRHKVLRDKLLNQNVMSDHDSEINSCKDFIDNSRGEVLMTGLGIGEMFNHMLDKCELIDVVEKFKEIIEMFDNPNKEKINIIHENIFDFKPTKKYDVIYIDIWNKSHGHTEEAKLLINKFKPFLKEKGWIGYWGD